VTNEHSCLDPVISGCYTGFIHI